MKPPDRCFVLLAVCLLAVIAIPGFAQAPYINTKNTYCNDDTCLQTDDLSGLNAQQVVAVVSAYNNLPEQTDSTPDIMASGNRVYEGAIACPIWLPFGTISKD